MVKSSWLYSLRKDELSDICGALDLDTKGTVEEMRKAAAALIATPDLAAEMRTKLAELEAKYTTKTLHLPTATERGTSPKRHFQEQMSSDAAMDRILEREERPSETAPAVVELIGSTLVADLSVGGLPTTGVVDTGATRSIIREDITGFIPFIKGSDTSSYTIRTADGSVQAGKNSITVEVNIGDMTLDLELLVVKRIYTNKTKQGNKQKHNNELYTDDFQRLAPGRWLNDRVIEAYAKWLLQEHTAVSIREQVHLASPFLYQKISQANPNWELLRRQARRDKALHKRCIIIPICAQSHWRLAIVAHPDIATPTRAIYILDSIGGYPTEQIATNIRRYVQFLNVEKYQHGVNMDHHALPQHAVSIPRQANSADCGVFLLRNLELYLNQNEDGWDPLTLPTAWCTMDEARHTRIVIAAKLLELAGEEGRAQPKSTETPATSDTAEDVVLINEEPIMARTMIAVEKPTSEIDDIDPTVGLLGGGVPPPRVEFGNNAEWTQLEEEDPLCQYLRAKYNKGAYPSTRYGLKPSQVRWFHKGLTVKGFIFRIEKLRPLAGISYDELFAGFHGLLNGKANRQLLEDRKNYFALKIKLQNQFKTPDSDHELIREVVACSDW
uniref:Ubiquitin-like protease family profile domain-containing protein n=1 Tax=Glossina pallidipes TaxID=7398 RepID=A0A1A9ZYU7_GLOPL